MIEYNDDDIVIVSLRCENPGPVLPGAIKFPCAECGSMVWLAPSAQRELAIARAVMCAECLIKNHGGLESHEIVPMSEYQKRELADQFGFTPPVTKQQISNYLKRFKED